MHSVQGIVTGLIRVGTPCELNTTTLNPDRLTSPFVLQLKVPDPLPSGLPNARVMSRTSCGQVNSCRQPLDEAQVSTVQSFESSQSSGWWPRQAPLLGSHSSTVQASPSSQSPPEVW